MAEYINFEVGQKFALPIRAKGDGGLFQVDADGMLFILQLSRTDAIAREAFRTGEMRFAFWKKTAFSFSSTRSTASLRKAGAMRRSPLPR